VRAGISRASDRLDPSDAVLALDTASDREQVFELLLRAARSRTRFAALLSVHADQLRGRRAIAEPELDTSRIGAISIPRNAVPTFERAIAGCAPVVASIATGEVFVDGLLEPLGVGLAPNALVLPIAIGTRTVALVVAHRGTARLALGDVADLFPLVSAASPALIRVLAARADVAGIARSGRADTIVEHGLQRRAQTEYEVEVSIVDADAKRIALARHRKHQAWADVADTIRDLIHEGVQHGDPDEDEQLELLVELGAVEAEQLGRPDRAIEALRSAQGIDAGDDRVLEALERLYTQQARWQECAELLEKRVALTSEPARRIPLLLALAAIAHERLDQDELAIEAYERVLALVPDGPDHDAAGRALEAIHVAREEWQALATLWIDRASKHDDLTALESVAQLYEDKLGDPRAAVLVWIAVLRRAPDDPRIPEHLDRLAPAADAWDELLAEGQAVATELEATHPAAAARVWHLVGRWTRDHLANRDDAARALDRALRLAPDDAETRSDLVEILRADSRWPELVTLLEQRAQTAQDPAQRAEYFAELGEIYQARLGQRDQAIFAYEEALAAEPEATSALVALHGLYADTEAWTALATLLPRLIAALSTTAPRTVLVDLYVELGTTLAEHLDRADDAVQAFQQALELDPKHAAAFHGLEQVYQATGQTQALLETTEAEVDAAGGPAQRYADLAAAWHDCSRLDRAVDCWHKVLALEPRLLAAHQGLTRALRDGAQWLALVDALRAQLRIDPHAIAVLVDLGEVLEQRLDDTEGAIGVFREVTALEPRNARALDALGRLHERATQWQAALDALELLLEDTRDPRARADLLQRIGSVHLGARELVKAQVTLGQAVALDPKSARAHEALARFHVQNGDPSLAGEELVRAAQLATAREDSIRCLADAAWLYRQRLEDPEKARACLNRILELDPGHADAKAALAELLHDTREWAALWPHLEHEAGRIVDDPAATPAQRHDAFVRAARCAVELGKFPAALALYDRAAPLDPGPATQLERAEALYRSKALDVAAAAYQTVTARHAAALDKAQLVTIYKRLAAIYDELDKASQAQLFYNKALDLVPADREALEGLAALYLARGRYDEAIASLRTIASQIGGEERASTLLRIGDLYRDKLSNPPRATSAYVEALELEPRNHRILQRLLDLQSETGQWKAAVETIDRFLDLETDPARRGAYFLAAAEISRTELKDRRGSIERFERGIDELLQESPLGAGARTRALEAFRAVHELAAADKSWKLLEQAHRRMIKRLPPDDPALLALWHALGDIYRMGLEHPQSAIEAYEVAHSLDPEKAPGRARLLAELYKAVGGNQQPAQVGARAAKLVEVDPTNPDAYRALGRASLEAGRIDEAWCVCRALVVLDRASTEETALYRRYQAHEVRKATGILDEDSWSLVRHPDEDRAISAVFALIWEAAAAMRAGPPKSFELKSKERLAVEDGTRVVAKIFRHAARVLNVPLPDVYIQPRRSGRLLLANCIEKGRLAPAVIVGRDLMTGYRDTEVAAAVGAMMALLRPAYQLKLTLGTVDELEAALVATAQLVGRKLAARPAIAPLVATLAPELQRRLTRPAAEALHALVERLPEPLDLARWRAAVDATAQRAALLICGELAATSRMMSTETSAIATGRPQQRVQELVAYSVSPGYFTVRRRLGVTVA
jgi:tetratricopeptide (TPR) repeat protein